MSFGYLGDTSTKIKQRVKNDGVLSIDDVRELEVNKQIGGSYQLVQTFDFGGAAFLDIDVSVLGGYDVVTWAYLWGGNYVEGGLVDDMEPYMSSELADPNYDMADIPMAVQEVYGRYRLASSPNPDAPFPQLARCAMMRDGGRRMALHLYYFLL